MKLYQLSQKKDANWDENISVTVIASSAKEARQAASEVAADEGAETWLQPSKSVCEVVKTGSPKIVSISNKGA